MPLSSTRNSSHTIKDPVHGNIKIPGSVLEVVDSPEMQRLRRVSQLGFSSLVYPGANHSRFEHSLGTYFLTKQVAQNLNLEDQALPVAGLLHDVGHSVSPHRHHRHTYYLVANADLPGLADRERELVALVARYHRRSAPSRSKADLQALGAAELRTVRALAALLRVADALDRSHQQLVRSLDLELRGRAARLRLRASGPVDLEAWDVRREAPLFRRVFGRRLELLLPA